MPVVQAKLLYRMAKECWYPQLQPLGFDERNGQYLRTLSTGAVHLIGMGKDPHGGDTFRVMCGVDALALKADVDSFGYNKHDRLLNLTPKGWETCSGCWPCGTEEEAHASVEALWPLIRDLALPWLETIQTLSDVANQINETRMPHLGWMKAKLYLLDGDIPRAHETLNRYTAFVAQPKPWLSEKRRQADRDHLEQVRLEIKAAGNQVD